MSKPVLNQVKQLIGAAIKLELTKQGFSIESLARETVSKRIIYNIIQGKNYTIDSLVKVVDELKKNNKTFKITV